MKSLLIAALLFSSLASAQEKNVAQFVIWEPKEGQALTFETGYRQHLQWHAANDDPWDWYGWYFTSGPRSGQFMDATVDHAWQDFDTPLKPAEDGADNKLHVYPFADLRAVMKLEKVASCGSNAGLQSRLLRMITLSATDINAAIAITRKLKDQLHTSCLYIYKVVDGGDINQLILLLAYNAYNEFGRDAALPEILERLDKQTSVAAIQHITSETLVFKKDMSRLH
ncbi:hypothetical protein L3C95_25805 [Chitinophaga filiformis]|uniref:hypothetical protein n=1 Tax=Chitinophaga filiformis TaxID=104663 RepID=UPI001F39EA35|nr:hypothetical protein [Chitinophaga filiformis]MCF6406337.1 hypothetical protein [Chitinophaga filiformis]